MRKSDVARSSILNPQSAIHNLSKGHALRLKGRFKQALNAYRKSLNGALTLDDGADAICGIAMSLRGLCRYSDAEAMFDVALDIYRFARDREGEAFALYGRGGARRFLGNFSEALKDLERSLKLTSDPEARLFTLMAIGGLQRMTGRFDDSLARYREARLLAGRLRHSYGMAYADCGIGNALRCRGEKKSARLHLQAADRRYRSIGDRVSRPYTLFALAMMDLESGKRPSLAEPRRLFRSTGDRRGLVYIALAEAVAAIAVKRDPRPAIKRAGASATALGLKLEAAHAEFLRTSNPVNLKIRNSKSAIRNIVRLYKSLGARPPISIFHIP